MAQVNLTEDNPNSDTMFAVVAAATTENYLTLNPHREYTLFHDAETIAGVADTNTVYLFSATGQTANETAAEGKFKLTYNRATVLGPGITTVYYLTEAGAPTFSVMAGRQERGHL